MKRLLLSGCSPSGMRRLHVYAFFGCSPFGDAPGCSRQGCASGCRPPVGGQRLSGCSPGGDAPGCSRQGCAFSAAGPKWGPCAFRLLSDRRCAWLLSVWRCAVRYSRAIAKVIFSKHFIGLEIASFKAIFLGTLFVGMTSSWVMFSGLLSQKQ